MPRSITTTGFPVRLTYANQQIYIHGFRGQATAAIVWYPLEYKEVRRPTAPAGSARCSFSCLHAYVIRVVQPQACIKLTGHGCSQLVITPVPGSQVGSFESHPGVGMFAVIPLIIQGIVWLVF